MKNGVVPLSPSAPLTSEMLMYSVPPPLQMLGMLALLRGAGAPVAKSAALSLVSVQPSPARRIAVLLLVAGAGALPSKKFALPNPTRSRMSACCAGLQALLPPLQPRVVVVLASTTLPAVPDMLIVPLASGVGSGLPLAPPASPTR